MALWGDRKKTMFENLLLNKLRKYSKPIELETGYPAAACFKNLNLVEIPLAMRKAGYSTGAALMERWFIGESFVLPKQWKDASVLGIDQRTIPDKYISDTIVKMQWVFGYERALKMYHELKASVTGNLTMQSLQRSQEELFRCLKIGGMFTDKTMQFGIGGVRNIHETAHVNSRAVASNNWEKLTDPLDDMYCALGAFTLHLAAAGTVVPVSDKKAGVTHKININKLGFYIRDNYDFNSDQPLGLWDHDGPSRIPSTRLALVENASFTKWRTLHRHGGDFLVFSDVRWEGVAQHLIWDYSGQ